MIFKIGMIAAYGLMIVIIGVIGMRRTSSFKDFFLGGGNVGPWMTAFTYGTAYFSAVLFIGFAGKIGWGFGYSSLWIMVGNALLGVFGVWFFLGPKIKKMSVDYQVHTMGEFLEKRYNSKFMKLFPSISIFIFFVPYTAAVFMGLSYLFKSTFGLDYTIALLLMGGFTAIYLVMGGYKSMTMIDMAFGMIMCVGTSILLISTINVGSGLSNITATLNSINPKLTQIVGPPGIWPLFSLVFLTSIAPFGMPQLVQKFYAIKDRQSIRVGMIASTFFAVLVSGVAYFTGAVARIFISPENAPNAFQNGKPVFDAIMPEFIANVIPPSLSVLILLLILAASMSTLAALVLISSSAVAKDVYAGFIQKDVSDKKLTLLMRIASGVFVLISVILAYFKPATIVSILSISWGAIGSVFLGPFIWGLFIKRVTKLSAILASTLGLTTCIVLSIAGMTPPESGTIGMMVSLIIPPIGMLFYK